MKQAQRHFPAFQCNNANIYYRWTSTARRTAQTALKGKKRKLVYVDTLNKVHSEISPPPIDQPVEKISAKIWHGILTEKQP